MIDRVESQNKKTLDKNIKSFFEMICLKLRTKEISEIPIFLHKYPIINI